MGSTIELWNSRDSDGEDLKNVLSGFYKVEVTSAIYGGTQAGKEGFDFNIPWDVNPENFIPRG